MLQTLIKLDPKRIAADPNNPRSSMDKAGLDSLADSIEELGLRQPITVRFVEEWGDGADGPEDHQVVFGHRRLEAIHIVNARRAKRGEEPIEVDCILVTGTDDADGNIDRDDLLAQLIENAQREDITPLDEARAYARALTFDLTQKGLARKVGRSPGHVSKRLKLLELPEVGQDLIDAGRLPIEEALELLAIPGVTSEIIADTLSHGRGAWHARQKVQELERRVKVDRATALAEQQGIPVERAQQGKDSWGASKQVVPAGAKGWVALSKWGGGGVAGLKGMELDPEKHRSEPCRGLYVHNDHNGPAIVECCTDPKRHLTKGESVVKTPRASTALDPKAKEERAATIARNKARREAADQRVATIKQHVKGRLPKVAAAFVIRAFVEEILGDGTNRAVNAKKFALFVLGIEVKGNVWGAESEALRKACTSEAETLRVGLALLLGIQHNGLENGYGDKDNALVSILTGWGYELSPQEKIDLKIARERRRKAEPKPKVEPVEDPELDAVLDDEAEEIEVDEDDDLDGFAGVEDGENGIAEQVA